MEEIKFSPLLLFKLETLVETHYNETSFGFLESSEDYVNNLIDYVYTIPSLKRKPTKNKESGAFYCKFKHNSKTTWYITFDIEDACFIIQDIINKHSANYPNFIANL